MTDILAGMIILVLIALFVVMVIKFRRQILEWLGDTRPNVDDRDISDLQVLRRYGIADAAERIKRANDDFENDVDTLRSP